MSTQFELDHAFSNPKWTASRVPALVLAPSERPRWMAAPNAVVAHMLGIAPLDQNETPIMRRGKQGEPTARQLVEEEHGLEVIEHRPEKVRVEHSVLPLLAYPDGLLADGRGLEIKAVNSRDFETVWAGKPPLAPRIQAQAQMLASDGKIEAVVICALVMEWYGAFRTEIFEEPAHPALQQLLGEKIDECTLLMQRGELPLPDESRSAYQTWARTVALAGEEPLVLDGMEAPERWQRWCQARLEYKAAEARIDAEKYWFTSRCGDASRITLADGTVIRRSKQKIGAHERRESQRIVWSEEKRK